MYKVDRRDKVVELEGVPPFDPGAPMPRVYSGDEGTFVEYNLRSWSYWDNVDWESDKLQRVVLVRFVNCYAHMFGPPNDEAFEGHPLASRGLERYGTYQVLNSSWIRILERMNRVHPKHDSESISDDHHYIFSFHDETFECLATGFTYEIHLATESSKTHHVFKPRF